MAGGVSAPPPQFGRSRTWRLAYASAPDLGRAQAKKRSTARSGKAGRGASGPQHLLLSSNKNAVVLSQSRSTRIPRAPRSVFELAHQLPHVDSAAPSVRRHHFGGFNFAPAFFVNLLAKSMAFAPPPILLPMASAPMKIENPPIRSQKSDAKLIATCGCGLEQACVQGRALLAAADA